MTQSIIALCGPADVGKSTLAGLLRSKEYKIIKFAAPIKSMLGAFLLSQRVGVSTIDRMLEGDLKEVRTEYFCGNTPRYAMQTLGTEWRNLLDTNLWVEAWKRTVDPYPKVVVDDMRFLHEAAAVRRLAGHIVLITREGIGPGLHPSESEYQQIEPNFVMTNNGTPEDMLVKLMVYLRVANGKH